MSDDGVMTRASIDHAYHVSGSTACTRDLLFNFN